MDKTVQKSTSHVETPLHILFRILLDPGPAPGDSRAEPRTRHSSKKALRTCAKPGPGKNPDFRGLQVEASDFIRGGAPADWPGRDSTGKKSKKRCAFFVAKVRLDRTTCRKTSVVRFVKRWQRHL